MSVSLFTRRLVLTSMVFQPSACQEVWDKAQMFPLESLVCVCFCMIQHLVWTRHLLKYLCFPHLCRWRVGKHRLKDLSTYIFPILCLELLWPWIHKKANIAPEKPRIGGHVCPYANLGWSHICFPLKLLNVVYYIWSIFVVCTSTSLYYLYHCLCIHIMHTLNALKINRTNNLVQILLNFLCIYMHIA